MSNQEEFKAYVLECLKRYSEQQQMSFDINANNFQEWLTFVEDELAQNDIAVYDPEEILEVFLATCMSHLNPTDEKSRNIRALVIEYCLQWTEMAIETSKGTNIIRPPYVINKSSYLTNRNKKENKDEWKKTVLPRLSQCLKSYSENLDYQDFGGSAVGKAHPDTIFNYLSRFCAEMDQETMQAELVRFCIGIDCSGFVSRALAYVMQHMGWGFKTQFKTIGPNKDSLLADNKALGKILSPKLDFSNKLNTAASFFKLYRNRDDKRYDYIYVKADKKAVNNVQGDDINDVRLMGSRLIYRFKRAYLKKEETVNGKKKKKYIGYLNWDRVNLVYSNDLNPQITNLRPGDIITIASNETFENDFHIAIICDVGFDLKGPFFITADSSPSDLAATVAFINDKHRHPSSYTILQSPDSMIPVDLANPRTNQSGSGVRYILHRDFEFFNFSSYVAFRRPYAFDLYYRNVNMEEK